MAQTKRKRRSKHRGTAAGSIEARGRTGRPPSADEKKKQTRTLAREERLNREPTWRSSANRAALASVLMFVVLSILPSGHTSASSRLASAAIFAVLAFCLYLPGGYYLERALWKRRQRNKGGRT
jgi:hypothetical protein